MSWSEAIEIPSKGLNTGDDPGVLGPGEAVTAQNVEFVTGCVAKRGGSRKVNSTRVNGGALRFHGNETFVGAPGNWAYIPNKAEYHDSTIRATMTVEITVSLETLSGGSAVIVLLSKSNTSNAAASQTMWTISQEQDGGAVERFVARFQDGTTAFSMTSTNTVATNTRYHIALTIADDRQNLFVYDLDGGGTGHQTATNSFTGDRLLDEAAPILANAIGRSSNGHVDYTSASFINDFPNRFWTLDEVRLWATALHSGSSAAAALTNYQNRELDTSHPNATSLRGYWKLNDRNGSGFVDTHTAIRGSGTNNNGFLEPRRPSFQAGLTPDEQGYCLRFDGYTDHGFVPTASTYSANIATAYNRHFADSTDISVCWCIEMSVRFLSSVASQTVFRWVTDDANNPHICTITTSAGGVFTVQISSTDGGGNEETDTLTGTTTLVTNTTYHVAVTSDYTQATDQRTYNLYVNGNTTAEDTDTSTATRVRGPDGSNQGILIARGSAYTSNFNIEVDEIRIWDNCGDAAPAADRVARTAAQINQYYDKPLPTKEINTAVTTANADGSGFMLIHYWKCDDNHRDYNDAPESTTAQEGTTANIAASDSGQTQQITGSNLVLGGIGMQLRPGSRLPEFAPGLLTGACAGGLVDLVKTYKLSDGTQSLVIAAEGRLFTAPTSIPGSLTTIDSSGFLGGNQAGNVIASDRLYLTNSQSPPLVYDGTSVRRWGIQGPTFQPVTFRSATATGVAGDVQYRYTYVSRSSGVESDPSPPSVVVRDNAGTNKLAIGVFISADPQVDAIRIYRTLHGATSGNPAPGSTDFFFVDEITNTSTLFAPISYTDQIGDASLGFALAGSEQGFRTSGPPPWGKYVAAFNGRLFVANESRSTTARNRLYYSQSLSPERFAAIDFIDVESGEGEPITGLAVLFDRLFIFKRSAIYALSGFGPSSFVLQEISKGIGCISHFSIVAVDGWLYWLSDRGPYRFNGGAFEWIGDKISDTFDGLDKSVLDRATACVNRDKHSVLFGMPATEGGRIDRVLNYDYANRAWSVFTGLRAQCMDTSIDSSGVNRYFFGDDQGFIYRGDVTDSFADGLFSFTTSGNRTSGTIAAVGTAGALVTVTVTNAHTATGDNWRGLRIEIDDADGGVSGESIILRQASQVLTLDTANFPLGFTPAIGDAYRIAAIDSIYDSRPFALSGPARLTHWREIEVEGKFQTDREASLLNVSTVTLTAGNASDYGSTFTTTTREVTVGNTASATTTANSSERFNLPDRARRYTVRLANDRPNESFTARTFCVRGDRAERT